MRTWIGLATLAGMAAWASVPAVSAPAKPTRAGVTASAANSVQGQLKAAAGKGVAYLRKSQQPDGSWERYPGITALCVLGMLRSGVPASDPAVVKATDYLAKLSKPNGGIYTDALGPAQALPNYNTALSLAALHATRNPKYAPVIKKAQQFLVTSQFDEGEGYSRGDSQYGGIGYGSREDNPDMSNLQNALEALRDSGYPKDAEVFKKALIFIQRCQNRKDSNDQAWSGTDGGFVYASSGESKADGYTKRPNSSYGSMTYAGLKSYLYANVTKSDPRVQAAWTWLRANYDVNQNPKMGDDGLYYYYHTMSKTLAVWGEKIVTDASGKKHAWGTELAQAIIRRQNADGSWTNRNPRWRENNAPLVTGYSLISLANCQRGL